MTIKRNDLLQLAKFEYEVRHQHLNLYDRINQVKGDETLRFLSQVEFFSEENLEESVKEAIDKSYSKMPTPLRMRILASDLQGKRQTINYIRVSGN